MKYLVDTDWVIDYLKGKPEAIEMLLSHADQGIAISLLTYGEVYEGILYGEERMVHETGFRNFLRSVPVVPLNRAIMRRFARIRGRLRREGRLIGDPDLLIAATVVELDMILLTRNVRHFKGVM